MPRHTPTMRALRLRRKREYLKIRRYELAQLLNIAPDRLGRIERGEQKDDALCNRAIRILTRKMSVYQLSLL